MQKLSVIIPTYQEAATIGDLVRHLYKHARGCDLEVIVSDGGSTDGTRAEAESAGAKVLVSKRKGRAAQLNIGAENAGGDIFYFLHADAFPPPSFCSDIFSAVEIGYDFGNFRQVILSENPWVKINSYGSRFKSLISSGGDQSLFIRKDFFEEIGHFREDFLMMEDYDFFRRAKRKGEHIKIPKNLRTVDRKYQYNSFLKVNLVNGFILGLYVLGVHPNKLHPLYKSWIKGPRYAELN